MEDRPDQIKGLISLYTQREMEISVEGSLVTIRLPPAIMYDRRWLLWRSRVIQEELESRKLIERAKDILAAESGTGGEEAYRKMQQMSMNMRRPMRPIAEAIIISRGVNESS